MAEANFTLTTFYTSWKEYQDRVKAALAQLTTEQLTLRDGANLRSIGEIAMHVVNCRAYWFGAFMQEEGGEKLLAYANWTEEELARGKVVPSPAELAQGLEDTWEFIAECTARWSASDMQKTFPDVYDGKQVDVSRAWVLWHILEHDLHHCGEISIILGTHSIAVDFPG